MKIKLAYGVVLFTVVSIFLSCQKEHRPSDQQQQLTTNASKAGERGHLQQTKTFSSEVVKRWLDVQLSMLNRPAGNPFGFNPSRYMAYCGIALYESVMPGMPAYQSLHGQLTDMPVMPATEPGYAYHWPTAANAALAAMTHKFFSLVPSVYNATAVTNLKNELNAQYLAETGSVIFNRSEAFGNEIANRIFEWAKTDNAGWPTNAYQLPAYQPGMWQPETPPGAAPANPYGGFTRLLVPGSLDNAISQPLAYSTDQASGYYLQMKEVYDTRQTLTHEQKRIARYFNDVNPGYPAGAHYVATVRQVLEQFNPALDKAALTYAKVGITMLDAITGSFKAKYEYLKERPFQFIRSHIQPGWMPYLSTPNFPDFPSNHAVFSSSVVYVLAGLYGSNTAFVDNTYEGVMVDLGNGLENLGSRHYTSFAQMEEEISMSRLYGGIHYRYSCDEGRKQGRKTAQNIESKLKFLK